MSTFRSQAESAGQPIAPDACPPSAPGRAAPESAASRGTTITGVVLCGGKSSRMGTDKALLRGPDGRTLLERAVAALDAHCGRVLVACGGAPRYADLGRPLVLDARADGGPLAGLEAALAATTTPRLFALACDMPFVSAATLERLLARAEADDLDVCMLATPAGVEPLCAAYSTACLEAVRAALDAGERRMVAFHGRTVGRPPAARALRVATVPAEDPATRGAPDAARNLNTPDDWAAFRGGAA